MAKIIKTTAFLMVIAVFPHSTSWADAPTLEGGETSQLEQAGKAGKTEQNSQAAPRAAQGAAPRTAQAESAPSQNLDPLEGFNRLMFSFNQQFDKFLLEPLAMGWDALPSEATDRVHNVLATVKQPMVVANQILQADRQAIGNSLATLLLNLTVGVGGLFDVATALGIGNEPTDLGITLGKWGVGSGAYVVMPVLGSTNFRDLFAAVAQGYGEPLYILERNEKITFFEYGMIQLTDGVDTRARLADDIDTLKKSSLDFYTSVRSVYNQRRQSQISEQISPADEALLEDLEKFEEMEEEYQ